MIGVMMFSTIELTICVNAAPMTTATARSMTLPRRMNALNPSTRSLMPEPSPEAVELASGAIAGTLTSCHEGARRGTPKMRVRVMGVGWVEAAGMVEGSGDDSRHPTPVTLTRA